MVQAVRWGGMSEIGMFVFLLTNLVIRIATICNYPPYNGVIAIILGCGIGMCCLIVIYPNYLKALLFLFGFSFFLFGFGSIDIQSRLFELMLTSLTITLFWVNRRKPGPGKINHNLTFFVLCYSALSVFSLLRMPVRQIVTDFWFFGFPESMYYLFTGPPYGYYYPVAMGIQLVLFAVLAVQISRLSDRVAVFMYLFIGIFSGTVFCAFIGLLDFYGIISLAWYRFGSLGTSSGVLHSTFQSRDVLGQYILTAIPFAMIGFMGRLNGTIWKIFLFGCLVICEVALILSGGRTGWVAYPLILVFCWTLSYFIRDGKIDFSHFGWKAVAKITISVPVTILLSILIVFYVLVPLSDNGTKENVAYQIDRIKQLHPGGRNVTWRQGFHVGTESPVFGMGYQSYLWHAHNLNQLSDSPLKKYNGGTILLDDSPHNVLITAFVDGGIVGVFLWVLIVGYALLILTVDLIRNHRLLNLPVIVSIISFHLFGMVQSMQVIPMIWFMIFLNIGYAMTIGDEVLPARVRRVSALLTKFCVVLVSVGLLLYASNFESRDLAAKNGLRIYDQDQERDRYAGFFQPSQRWQYGDYRWCGKRGAIYVPGGGDVELEFRCQTPGVDKEPLVLTVFYDGRILDTISFSKEESVVKTYSLPVTPGTDQKIVLEVSRTWNAHKYLNNFDRRDLGIGVKILK